MGQIVSSDSMQIYKDMNIGTAKPTKEEMQGIKHYLLDFVSPDERYSVADYKKDAKKAIKEIIEKIRPFLINDGGDVEFVKFENGTAYVKMVGNCANCLYSDLTMSETIETILTSEIPEVTKVEEYRD